VQDYDQAYDFETFQSSAPQKQSTIIELPSLDSRRKSKYKQKLKFWTVCFSVFLASGVGVGGFLFSQAKLAEYTHHAAMIGKKLEEFKNQNEQLQIKLASNSPVVSSESNGVTPREDYVEVITISAGDKAELN